MILYHLTHETNVAAIKAEGLRADDEGNIFCFTDMMAANTIARDQVFARRYGVFEVHPFATVGRIRRDRVGEFSSGLHRIVKAKSIAADLLTFIGLFDVVEGRATEFDYIKYERLNGWGKAAVDEFFAAMAWPTLPATQATHTDEEIERIVNARFAKLYEDYPPVPRER